MQNKFLRRAEYHVTMAKKTFEQARNSMPDVTKPMAEFTAQAETYARHCSTAQVEACAQLEAARMLASYGNLVENGSWTLTQAFEALRDAVIRESCRIDAGTVDARRRQTLLAGVLARDAEYLQSTIE